MDKIIIKGARENNLKNISLELPKNKLIVMTGLSGSGKSSLAFDTIYQEGQRRFIESLSSYARQFIGSQEKPDVDSIEGLSPAIAIDQKSTSHNPRSTVGTVTEIYDYLRLLYAKVGTPYCPNHNEPIQALSQIEMTDRIMNIKENEKVYIMSPVVVRGKGEHKQLLEKYLKEGFIRAIIDGTPCELDSNISLDKNKKHDIDIIVERLVMKDSVRDRVSSAVELSCKYSNGYVKVKSDTEEYFMSEHYSCKYCGYSVPKLEPRLFSFNSPLGACPECHGLGFKQIVSPDLMIDKEKSLNDGAIIPYRNQGEENLTLAELIQTCDHFKIDMDTKWKDLKLDKQNIILFGSTEQITYKMVSSGGHKHEKKSAFEGIVNNFSRRYLETNSDWIREWIENYMVSGECESCHGKRLNPMMLSVRIADKNIIDVCDMPIEKSYLFFKNLKLSKEKEEIAKQVIKEICDRLKFLLDVGLEYLTLSRSAITLSGGESQRIRLATQIGSQLTGVLYVLDEPSIGLHQRDNSRLIETLKKMRDLGNTVIVVEHDEDTMRASDFLVDIGPGAGIHGGKVMAIGTPEEVMQVKDSITAKYLRHELSIPLPGEIRKGSGKEIKVVKASENNLKNITVSFPLGKLILVTGVSGSGKSSLVNDVLFNNVYYNIYHSKKVVRGKCEKILGMEYIDRAIQITQEPIGRTPRSNPATYCGLFDDIRDLFSLTVDAKALGYNKSRFSFNVKGGRCEACSGDGVKRISMHFLPDVYVPCEVCHGTRYKQETLEIKYKGKNIAEVLDMTVEDACEFFKPIPKIYNKVKTLFDVGLGYIKLGQSSTTLSGGEAQRVKLASELNSRITSSTLYVLDEPTTGLHSEDIKKLLGVINRIVSEGATVVIIEHNLDVIKQADYIVDLGPEGGDKGGTVVFAGSPYDLVKEPKSYTGKYLAPYLKK